MKRFLIIASLIATPAMAENDSVKNGAGTQTVQICNQAKLEKCKTKTVYMTYKQQARIQALEAEVAKLKAENSKLSVAIAEAKAEVTVGILPIEPTPKPQYIERDAHAISLMLPYSPTGLRVEEKTDGSYKAKTVYELGLGVMYQYDSYDDDEPEDGATRFSIGVDTLGTAQLGLGFTW